MRGVTHVLDEVDGVMTVLRAGYVIPRLSVVR